MALVADFICLVCRKDKHEVVEHTGICQDCRWKKYNKAKRQFLAGLMGLTPEERLARIEEMLYDNPPHEHTDIIY